MNQVVTARPAVTVTLTRGVRLSLSLAWIFAGRVPQWLPGPQSTVTSRVTQARGDLDDSDSESLPAPGSPAPASLGVSGLGKFWRNSG
jgi:hypothetical protein